MAIANLKPVPRFPDRGHALFLATGLESGKPVLMGLNVSDDPHRNAAPPVSGPKLLPGPSEALGFDLKAPLNAPQTGHPRRLPPRRRRPNARFPHTGRGPFL